MGSHLGAIGIPADEDFGAVMHQLLAGSTLLGSSPDGLLDVYVFQDSSGSRSTITLEARRVTCFTPTFGPGTRQRVTVGSLADDECPYERPLLVDVLDDEGEMIHPLAVAIEDLAISASSLTEGAPATLEAVALAERIEVYADESAYRATGTPMATESLIPSGMFAPGGEEPEGFNVRPLILMSGTVRSAELRRHALFDHPFVTLRVTSYGGEYAVCVDINDLGGPDEPQVPAVGSIVSGEFYLSGRLVADASPAR